MVFALYMICDILCRVQRLTSLPMELIKASEYLQVSSVSKFFIISSQTLSGSSRERNSTWRIRTSSSPPLPPQAQAETTVCCARYLIERLLTQVASAHRYDIHCSVAGVSSCIDRVNEVILEPKFINLLNIGYFVAMSYGIAGSKNITGFSFMTKQNKL